MGRSIIKIAKEGMELDHKELIMRRYGEGSLLPIGNTVGPLERRLGMLVRWVKSPNRQWRILAENHPDFRIKWPLWKGPFYLMRQAWCVAA
jgi:hypothetical protein